MPIIKCKMCGGDLRIEESSTVCECEYCGTRQTVPSADNEKKLTLFSRAGRLLRGCEFDKAAGVFETIVADFPEEAEAYWGLVLCKYGIEYVDDPATGKKIPTCHRSSFDSVMDDPNFEQACENTDALARRVYRDEARQIEDLRKRIIEVSGKEEPYDVFISYKETDENGGRTLDSVIAQDIYTELTEKGYRVFFSRISLEDKLGTEYEPYIFAALNSAKVMLVVGTDYENFDSVWVKNEWSRFLKLISSGHKKTLIPVFKNMDAYDMPKEFAKLAAQDMGKVGAMQDLVRGVEKLVRKKTAPSPAQQPQQVIVQQSGGPNTAALLKRGQQALEDCNWDKAREFFDRVLDIDAENSDAFFGLFLSEARCINEENYINKACAKNSQTEMLKISPATERIEKIVKQYTVIDYLPENELRAIFQYDLGYPSCVKAKLNLATAEKQNFEKNRNLARAIRYSQDEETARAILFKARLYAELDAGIKKAMDQEADAREDKQKSYGAFLIAAEKKAEAKYQRALESLEENRRKRFDNYEAIEDEHRAVMEHAAAGHKDTLSVWQDAFRRCNKAQGLIATGSQHSVALKVDGRVVAAGANYYGQCNVSDWTDIVFVAAGAYHTVGLKADGTVIAIGKNEYGQCNVDNWANIVSISAGGEWTVGIKRDGTIIAVGNNNINYSELSTWKNITKIAVGTENIVGLKTDGTVIAIGKNDKGQCDVSTWTDVVSIAAGAHHTVGMKSNGRVMTTDIESEGSFKIQNWECVVAVAAGWCHTVGLRSDGTVQTTCKFRVQGRGVGLEPGTDIEWDDIVAISESYTHTIGLKSDGIVVSSGSNYSGQCNTSDWKLFDSLDTLEAERKAAAERAEEERKATMAKAESERKKKISNLKSDRTKLQSELAHLHGLFSGRRRREIEARIGEIDTELKKLQ